MSITPDWKERLDALAAIKNTPLQKPLRLYVPYKIGSAKETEKELLRLVAARAIRRADIKVITREVAVKSNGQLYGRKEKHRWFYVATTVTESETQSFRLFSYALLKAYDWCCIGQAHGKRFSRWRYTVGEEIAIEARNRGIDRTRELRLMGSLAEKKVWESFGAVNFNNFNPAVSYWADYDAFLYSEGYKEIAEEKAWLR